MTDNNLTDLPVAVTSVIGVSQYLQIATFDVENS